MLLLTSSRGTRQWLCTSYYYREPGVHWQGSQLWVSPGWAAIRAAQAFVSWVVWLRNFCRIQPCFSTLTMFNAFCHAALPTYKRAIVVNRVLLCTAGQYFEYLVQSHYSRMSCSVHCVLCTCMHSVQANFHDTATCGDDDTHRPLG